MENECELIDSAFSESKTIDAASMIRPHTRVFWTVSSSVKWCQTNKNSNKKEQEDQEIILVWLMQQPRLQKLRRDDCVFNLVY